MSQHASAPVKPATDDEERGGGSGGSGAPPRGGSAEGKPAEQVRQIQPPSGNTGVDIGPVLGRFDYYAVSVRADPQELVDGLAAEIHSDEKRHGRGQRGYAFSVELMRDGRIIARVLAGGRNPVPHAFASGMDSVEFAAAVRRRWPAPLHWVTRADVAYDYDGPGAFSQLSGIALNVADDLGLTISQAGDWAREGVAGRTLYLGSVKSPLLLRVYEKGKQLGPEYSPDWVRVELQVRPLKRARFRAAEVDADALMGFGHWPRVLAEQLGLAAVERVTMWERPKPEMEKTLEYVTSHFFRMLVWLRDRNGGSWERAGLELGRLVEIHEHRRMKR